MPVDVTHWNRLGGAFGYLLLAHGSVVLDRPQLGAAAILAVVGLKLTRNASSGWPNAKLAAGLTAIAAAILLLVLYFGVGETDLNEAIYVTPTLLTGYLAWLFGRSLGPGREPLITRFCRLERGEVPTPLARYTKRLTLAWTVLLAAMTIEVIVLAVAVDLETWSWYANVVNPSVVVFFFAIEHPYRFWRYAHFGPYSLRRTFRIMLNRDSWSTR